MASDKLVPKTLSRNVTLEQMYAAERAMFPEWAAKAKQEAEQARKNAIRLNKADVAFEKDMIPKRADKRQASPTKTWAKRTSPVHKSPVSSIRVEVPVPKRPVRRAPAKPKAGTVKVTAAAAKKKASVAAKTTGGLRVVAPRKKPQLISVDYFQK